METKRKIRETHSGLVRRRLQRYSVILLLLLAVTLTGCGKKKKESSEWIPPRQQTENQVGTQSGIQSEPQSEGNALTMEQVIAWYEQGELGNISPGQWLAYDNARQETPGADVTVDISYNGLSYSLMVSLESQEVKSINLRNERGEDRTIYAQGDLSASSVTNLMVFLDHGTALDQEISYQLPAGLQNGSCYYDMTMDHSLGRLWFPQGSEQSGIFGLLRTMLWSCDGGVASLDNSLMQQSEDGILRFPWGEYSGNGISAVGSNDVLTFENGQLESVEGMQIGEGSVEGVLIRQAAAAGDPVWYLPPAQSTEQIFSPASGSTTQLVPAQLWVMCARGSELSDKAYVFFLNAQKYTRTDAEKILQSLQFLQG